MTIRSGPAQLRALLQAGFVAAPGACDPFTAKLIERAGFEALYLGGNALGLSLAKGQPLITLTETVNHAAAILRSCDLPLVVDAGAGFGAVAHVHRTVREVEATGAAALHIDDQPYPKSPSYHRGSGGLAPLDEATAKIAVAVQARRDPDFVLIARTDALRVTGSVVTTIERARAYAAAGADIVMILDLEPDGVGAVRAALPDVKIAWLGGATGPIARLPDMASAGFALACFPFNTVAAIADVVGTLWRRVRETGEIPQDTAFLAHWRRELAEIAGMPTYWAIEDALAARKDAP